MYFRSLKIINLARRSVIQALVRPFVVVVPEDHSQYVKVPYRLGLTCSPFRLSHAIIRLTPQLGCCVYCLSGISIISRFRADSLLRFFSRSSNGSVPKARTACAWRVFLLRVPEPCYGQTRPSRASQIFLSQLTSYLSWPAFL